MTGYMRRQIFFVYNYTCQYCNNRCEESHLEVDHIHPKSLGGEDRLSNYTVACFHCNRKKKDSLLPESYKALLLTVAERKAVVIKRRIADMGRRRNCGKRLEEINKLPHVRVSFSDPAVGPLGWLYTNPRKTLQLEKIELSYPSPRSFLQPKLLSFLLTQLGSMGDRHNGQVRLTQALPNTKLLLFTEEEIEEVLDWSFQMWLSIGGGSCGIFSHVSLSRHIDSGSFDQLTLSSILSTSELANVSQMVGII